MWRVGFQKTFFFKFLYIENTYCLFFFTHYTLHFTKKNGVRKTAYGKRCAKRTAKKMAHEIRRVIKWPCQNSHPKNRDRKMAQKTTREKRPTKNAAPKMAHEIEGLWMGHITKYLLCQKKKRMKNTHKKKT